MNKLKTYWLVGAILAVIILSGIFYWFQIRPMKIKKNCSWTREIIPADAGITIEQADMNKKAFEQCNANNIGKVVSIRCWLLGNRDSKERPPQPEKEVVREATENEYNMCLRQHG